MTNPTVTIIAAIGRNRELGRGNDLLWKIPDDLAHFRARTKGHPIIMGRKTYESLPFKPLPHRTNIIVTRDASLSLPDCLVVSSIGSAIEAARTAPGADEIYVIGGAQIYAAALPFADMLDITVIEAEDTTADVFFPPFEEAFPTIVSDEAHEWEGLRYHFQIRTR